MILFSTCASTSTKLYYSYYYSTGNYLIIYRNIFTSGTCAADIPVNIEVRLVELTCFVGHFVDENYTEGILD